ncbi:unnamed protein product [Cunninghamella blakesleeana]
MKNTWFLFPLFLFFTIPLQYVLLYTLWRAFLSNWLAVFGFHHVSHEEQEKSIRLSWLDKRYTLHFMDFPNGLQQATVKDLKEKCKRVTNVPIANMRLKVSGAHIKDDTATLSSVGIHPYCTVELSGEEVDQNQVEKEIKSGNMEEYGLVKRITDIIDDLSKHVMEEMDAFEVFVNEQQKEKENGINITEENKKKMQDKGLYFSERLMQALLKLDSVDCPMGFDTAKQKRRESVRFTQKLLDRVDVIRSTVRTLCKN